jgi:hypothetical protein
MTLETFEDKSRASWHKTKKGELPRKVSNITGPVGRLLTSCTLALCKLRVKMLLDPQVPPHATNPLQAK